MHVFWLVCVYTKSTYSTPLVHVIPRHSAHQPSVKCRLRRRRQRISVYDPALCVFTPTVYKMLKTSWQLSDFSGGDCACMLKRRRRCRQCHDQTHACMHAWQLLCGTVVSCYKCQHHIRPRCERRDMSFSYSNLQSIILRIHGQDDVSMLHGLDSRTSGREYANTLKMYFWALLGKTFFCTEFVTTVSRHARCVYAFGRCTAWRVSLAAFNSLVAGFLAPQQPPPEEASLLLSVGFLRRQCHTLLLPCEQTVTSRYAETIKPSQHRELCRGSPKTRAEAHLTLRCRVPQDLRLGTLQFFHYFFCFADVLRPQSP